MAGTRLYQMLDEPDRFLIFTIDEFLLLAGCLVIGFGFGMPITGIVTFVVSWNVWKRAKRGLSIRNLIASLYWVLPAHMVRLRRSPDSVIREWVG
ncbi:type IV conjugative transfer system protein TraL (plasmid) [Glycocaulis abyssi]|jgi:type IV conjugative transfer system protein TraL|uniref:Type IV conjugative transfer system protein TraL n=2 Tax=Glycocaulis TaxID=1433402 RepID=A0ABQ1XW77_9PROT|nr:type IV conjugative transfer system protein TraL [Glycocaulis albus]GGH04966.1 hypothetical protein GCM10007420_21780 [Glycocaulis albus]HCY54804.1 type IV conjugative transfer system protein TraL [Oceanicaulis sp.]